MAKTILIFPLALTLAVSLLANPQDASVQSGSVSCTSSNNLLEIRASDGAVIHWQDFSIQPNEVTRFIQPGETSKVLNRVMGPNASSLLGSLEANGQVFLINRNGILIGKDARIDTNGLFVSTYDLNNEDFMNGGEWNLRGSGGTIVHYGTIQAGDGDVYLIAQKIENRGSIEAGAIRMASAPEILICPEGNEKIIIRPSAGAFAGSIDDSGYLKAAEIELRASANPYSWAIRHTGEAQAKAIVASNGRIFLRTEGQAQIDGTLVADSVSVLADAIEVLPNAKIDVTSVKNGGSVQIGKKGRTRYVRVDKGAEIFADGVKGGNVLVWGDDVMAFNGSISARGTAEGGFVELSSAHFLMPSGFVDTRGPIMGKLLLDPSDVTIALANSNLGPFLPPPTPPPSPPVTNYSFSGSPATILNTDLQNFLATTNVVINTANGTGGTGVITVNAPVAWSSSFSLYLEANQDILFNNLISCTGGGGVVLQAGNNITASATTIPVGISLNSGTITATAANNLSLSGGNSANATSLFNTISGAIAISAGGALTLTGGNSPTTQAEIGSIGGAIGINQVGGLLTLQGGGGTNAYAQIGKGALSSPSAITSNISFQNINSDIRVFGGTQTGAYAQIGHSPFGGGGNSTVTSNISLPTGQTVGQLLLTGGSASQTSAVVGHGNDLSSLLTNVTSSLLDIEVEGNIVLQGGTGSYSHAVIGFLNPHGGSNFTVQCTTLNAISQVVSNVTLTAGTGSNAVIGYYNGSSVGSGANVTIQTLTAKTATGRTMTIQAGNTGGIGQGIAAIGTFDANGPAKSNINIQAGRLFVTGPAGANDGAARIINNNPTQGSAPFNIVINLGGLSDATILGGNSASGFADIYACQDLIFDCSGTLILNNTSQLGLAKIAAYSDVLINTGKTASTINIAGGASANAEALIQCTNGPVQIGVGTQPGAFAMTLGDASSAAPSLIQSASGSAYVIIDGPLTLTGGNGASTPFAKIMQDSGTLNVSTATALTLSGGTSNLSYTEISSRNGLLTITIGTDANLTGGNGTNAYAQIGKGIYTPPPAFINSSINFVTLGGALNIFGGGGVGAYAQIGHSPFNTGSPVTVTGDITFPGAATGGIVHLRGGTTAQTTAIIGHGNELSTFISSCSGAISLVSNSTITLDAGSGANTAAIIGFQSPSGGSSTTFNVNSNSVSVEALSGDIILNASNGNNANIGYYNAATPSSVALTVNLVKVHADGNHNLTLNAGNDAGTHAGVAAIGTYTSASSIAQGGIDVLGGVVLLQGPSSGNDGSARIINNNNLTPVSADFDVKIVSTSTRLVGGMGNAFADIYSSRDLEIDFNTLFDVNNDISGLQNGYAHIKAYRNIGMNPSGGTGTSTLKGGKIFTADALIESYHGFVSLGPTTGTGTFDLFIGDATSKAPSKIVAHDNFNYIGAINNIALQGGVDPNTVAFIQDTSGDINVSAGGNLTLTGGTGGNNASAEITNVNGGVAFKSGGNTILQGGGSPQCFARITSDTGAITSSSIGNNLTLNGGSDTECFAQIGKGFDTAITFVSSSITLSSIGGDLLLQGGTASDCYVQIGHSPYGGTLPITIASALSINFVSGNTTLNSSSGANTTAIIGHGNELTNLVESISGSVSLTSGGLIGITLNPGTGTLTHTTIGAHSPSAGTMFGLTCNMSSVSVEATSGSITLNGGEQLNAVIGYYNDTTAPTLDITISQINVQTSFVDSVSDSIILQAGNNNGSNCGVAAIGTFVSDMSTSQSNINIQCGWLQVLGPITTMAMVANDGSAVIFNNQPNTAAGNNVTIQTQRTTIIGGTGAATGFAEIFSSNLMTLSFEQALNVNLDPNNTSTLQNGNATIISVSDMTINPDPTTGVWTMVGGATTAVLTDVESLQGDILMGFYPNVTGPQDLFIGRSDMIGATRILSDLGNIAGAASGNLFLQGGTGANSLAELSANQSLKLNFNEEMNLTSGSGGGALTQLVGNNGDVDLFFMGDASMTGNGNISQILNLGGQQGYLDFNTLGNITMNTNTLVQNQGNGPSTIGANANITMNSTSKIQNTGIGDLSLFAGVSGFFNGASIVQSAQGSLTVVVDNLYPTPPQQGSGSFITAAGNKFTSGGPLRIFTAEREQNSIDGLLNFHDFVPGIEFVNTATEQWKTYYPSSFGGVPYTIFYKGSSNGPTPNPLPIAETTMAFLDFFTTLYVFDDPLFTEVAFTLGEGTETQTVYVMSRYYRNYNTKIIDPLK
ncbi:MAG: filamentous hemagglutinin N-terminal domain-containing protein [Verrucomicrobia bacterium]|nr:filamentous hemagglutinin N-terminal domain-containing protein [Verrucomicrobiota bacterium]